MDLINAGQRLSISFPKGNSLVEMTCTVARVLDDRLDINLPSYFMRYIEYLKVGCKLTAKVFSKLGTIDFNTIVINSPLEDIFSVEMDTNAMKLIPSDEISVINAVEKLNILMDDVVINVKTFEISTEYLKFYSDRKFAKDDSFDCELILPKNYGIIKFKAVVTDIDQVYEDEYTVAYFSMTEDDRQGLLYYMYVYSNNSDWEQ